MIFLQDAGGEGEEDNEPGKILASRKDFEMNYSLENELAL